MLRGDELRVCTRSAQSEFELRIYNYILSAFSILAIISYIIYYLAKSRRTVTGNFVVSSLATLAAGLIFYCLIHENQSMVACRVIASFSQYFLLSVHTWTNAIGIWMIRGMTSFRRADDFGWKTFCQYAAYAWGTPLAFVLLAYFLNWNEGEVFYPVFAENLCFIASGWSRLLVFTGPIYFFIVVNAILCVVATIRILQSGSNISHKDKSVLRKKIITIVKLQVVFGFHWVLLLFTLIEGSHQEVLWTILNIFLTLQGVTVVLVQIFTTKNIKKMKAVYQSKAGSKSTSDTSYSNTSASKSNRVELSSLASRTT